MQTGDAIQSGQRRGDRRCERGDHRVGRGGARAIIMSKLKVSMAMILFAAVLVTGEGLGDA